MRDQINQLVIDIDKITPLLHDNNKDLKKACKKSIFQVRARILGVNMVCMNNASIQFTDDSLLQRLNWVAMWLHRFKEGSTEALVDLPKSGIQPKVKLGKIAKVVSDR